jgi:hypothetical protein
MTGQLVNFPLCSFARFLDAHYRPPKNYLGGRIATSKAAQTVAETVVTHRLVILSKVPRGWSDPAMLRQHKLNRHIIFVEGSPNLMQALPRLPAAPHVVPLLLRELEAPPKCHKHHLIEKDLYQMVLQRPVELERLIGMWPWNLWVGFPRINMGAFNRCVGSAYPQNCLESAHVKEQFHLIWQGIVLGCRQPLAHPA